MSSEYNYKCSSLPGLKFNIFGSNQWEPIVSYMIKGFQNAFDVPIPMGQDRPGHGEATSRPGLHPDSGIIPTMSDFVVDETNFTVQLRPANADLAADKGISKWATFAHQEATLLTDWAGHGHTLPHVLGGVFTDPTGYRARMMWQPTLPAPEGLGTTYDWLTYSGFYKSVTLIPTGLPAFDGNGFMDSSSDFTYMQINRMYGLDFQPWTSTGLTAYHPLRINDLAPSTGRSSGFASWASPIITQFCDVLPCNQSLEHFLKNYYQYNERRFIPGYSEERTEGAGGFGYAESTQMPICIKFGMVYDTDSQSYTGFPRFDHWKARLRPERGVGTLSEAVADWNAATSPADLRYNIVESSISRLEPANVVLQTKAEMAARGHSIGLSYLDSNSSWEDNYLKVYKMRYPRPFDGEEMNYYDSQSGWIIDSEYRMDCTKPPDDEEDGPTSDLELQLRTGHLEAAVAGQYVMYWGGVGGTGGAAARLKDVTNLKLMLGTSTVSFAMAFLRLDMMIKKLQSAWAYDDTPREARIRMQKAQPYDIQNLSSIKSDSMDAIYEDDRPDHEFDYVDDSMVRELGSERTPEDIRRLDEATGGDYE